MLENRSFDHFFGWSSDLLGTDGLTGDETNLLNTSDHGGDSYAVNADAPYLNNCDPDHGLPGTTSKIFGAAAVAAGDLSTPTMGGFVEWENRRGNAGKNYCDVMSMFTAAEQLPVITALAQELGVMDRFFASVPGPTW